MDTKPKRTFLIIFLLILTTWIFKLRFYMCISFCEWMKEAKKMIISWSNHFMLLSYYIMLYKLYCIKYYYYYIILYTVYGKTNSTECCVYLIHILVMVRVVSGMHCTLNTICFAVYCIKTALSINAMSIIGMKKFIWFFSRRGEYKE